jgi:hypothetical protein
MMKRTPPPAPLRLLHASLVFIWLATALVSAMEWQGQSVALLMRAHIVDATLQHAIIGAGIAADLAIGIGLAWHPGRTACGAALLGVVTMTVVATLLLPRLWLDPLGPLLKNLPIAAALLLLIRQDTR